MVTESNNSNIPPYVVNLFNRDQLDCGTVDITKFMSFDGLCFYLNGLSDLFHKLHLPSEFDNQQLYFVAQENFEAIKIGVSKIPFRRLIDLQVGNPNKLKLLFFYDSIVYQKETKLFESDPMMYGYTYESHMRAWFSGKQENALFGEWIKPDERSLRMLIKEGFYVLSWYKCNGYKEKLNE